MGIAPFNSRLITFPCCNTPRILSTLLSFTLLSSLNVPLSAASTPLPYDLDQAIEVALENNRLRTISQQSLATSRENRNLTRRAYQTGAVETQSVIKANLYDAMIRANHHRAMHDQALYLAEISYLLGKVATE